MGKENKVTNDKNKLAEHKRMTEKILYMYINYSKSGA